MSTDAEHQLDAYPAIRTPYRLQWESAQSSWVLLYPEGMVKLSASAAEIMQRCRGELTVEALIAELEAAFKSAQIHSDVMAFLGMALKQGWIHLRDRQG